MHRRNTEANTPGNTGNTSREMPVHSDVWDRDYPRIQIRTIEELLDGKQFEIPKHHSTYEPAERVRRPEGRQGRLDEVVGA